MLCKWVCAQLVSEYTKVGADLDGDSVYGIVYPDIKNLILIDIASTHLKHTL